MPPASSSPRRRPPCPDRPPSRATGDAAWLELSGFPGLLAAGATHRLTVTARDPAGDLASDYRGTVHFAATDLLAGLPADYTFTAADGGVRTFPVTLNTPGVWSLTTADVSNPLLGATRGDITVHDGMLPVVPLANPRALVYDDARGILYVTTNRGALERLRRCHPVAARARCASGRLAQRRRHHPIRLGPLRRGGPGTAPNQLLVHRVDLADGSVRDHRYRHERLDGGAGDVVVLANGGALVSPGFPQALEPVLELDPATGAFAPQYVDAFNRYAVPYASQLDRGAYCAHCAAPAHRHYHRPRRPLQCRHRPVHGPGQRRLLGPTCRAPSAAIRPSWPCAFEKGHFLSEGAGIFDAQLNSVRVLPGIDGGMAFDPVRDAFYGVDSSADRLIAFDSRTWEEKYHVPLGIGRRRPPARPGRVRPPSVPTGKCCSSPCRRASGSSTCRSRRPGRRCCA